MNCEGDTRKTRKFAAKWDVYIELNVNPISYIIEVIQNIFGVFWVNGHSYENILCCIGII